MVGSRIARDATSLSLFVCITLYILTLLNHSDINRSGVVEKQSIQHIAANISCASWQLNHDYIASAARHMHSGLGYVILTSSDWNYRAIAMNFMAHMYHIQVLNFLVICLDEKTLSLVGSWENGGHGLYSSGCNSNNKIFQIRHRIAEVLLANNLTVVLSDGDCVWLKDFYASWLSSYRYSVDVIAQMGKYPVNVLYEHGAAACAGLLVVNPTPAARVLYRTFVSRLALSATDDQVILNTVLMELNAFQFEGRLPQTLTPLPTNGTPRLHLPRPANKSSSSVRLGFLPHLQFPRIPLSTHGRGFAACGRYLEHDPCVWHLAPPKGAAGGSSPRVHLLKMSGTFALHSDWHTLDKWNQLKPYFRLLTFRNHSAVASGL